MSTLGDFCGTTPGDFMGSALGDRGCDCYGCSFLPHTFSVELSGISGSLVSYLSGEPASEPFDLSICNQIYSISVPAWSEPECSSFDFSTHRGPLLWFYRGWVGMYVEYWLSLRYRAAYDGNYITAGLHIWVTPIEQALTIEWSIVLPWTEDDCCDGIGRNLPMVGAYHIAYRNIHLSPGTGDGSICTLTS